ncbi:MAG TPA: hypothetical protein VGE01_00035 [Fimbriimonas sp.]
MERGPSWSSDTDSPEFDGFYRRPLALEREAVDRVEQTSQRLVWALYASLVTDILYFFYDLSGLWVDLSGDETGLFVLGFPALGAMLATVVLFAAWVSRSVRASSLLDPSARSVASGWLGAAALLLFPSWPFLIQFVAKRSGGREAAKVALRWSVPLTLAILLVLATLHPKYEEVYSGPAYAEYLALEFVGAIAETFAVFGGVATLRRLVLAHRSRLERLSAGTP